jgi:hypothetical protein
VSELYGQVIDLLNQAVDSQKFAALRARYAGEGDKAEEVVAAKMSALTAWLKAKEIYCSNKDLLDACFMASPNNNFKIMIEVIDEEIRETVELGVLGKIFGQS